MGDAKAQAEEKILETPQAQNVLRRLAVRRAISALSLIAALSLFLLWLPSSSRFLLIRSLIANRLFVFLLIGFSLVALSLFWSIGQRFDVWLFRALNLRNARSALMDRVMWISTQIGNVGFAVAVSVVAFVLGDRRFAIYFTLGSLSLMLLVTVIKAFTDRARPFKMMQEARVVGWREAGLSFPSGHTAQTFFMMTFVTRSFEPPILIVLVLYAIALLVGATRVYLGVHYPRDVMAGAILGGIWAVLITLVSPYL